MATGYLSKSTKAELKATAEALVAPGRGILAADECETAMTQRFSGIGVENTEENRRRYRQIIFSTAKKDLEPLAGVILQHETCYQKNDAGVPLIQLLKDRGIIPGVTLDHGWVPLHGGQIGELTTQGLEDLDKRCAQYYKDGLRFAKWRSAFIIKGENTPSDLAVINNAHVAARYASICQVHGLVPIVEPDIDVVNGDHSLEKAAQVCERVLGTFFKILQDYGVYLEGIVLKTSMAVPGKSAVTFASTRPEDIAKATVTVFSRTVPIAVPGVAFLSGGQTEEEATLNLNAINRYDEVPKPWKLTFSYGRAMQASALAAWKGNDSNAKGVQDALAKRAACNSKASLGKY